jgi:hypothetical protein
MVFTINPSLVRTAMPRGGLSCGEPRIEQFFTDALANKSDVSTELAAHSPLASAHSATQVKVGELAGLPLLACAIWRQGGPA